MRKRILISVVLAVFLLEVGFGVYVALERKYESALNSLNLPIDAVKQIETDTDREFEIASLSPTEDFTTDTRVDVATKRLHTRHFVPNNAGRKNVSTSLAANRPVKPVVKTRTGPIKLVVAEKTVEYREPSATSLNAQKEPPRAEDKSLVTKTLSALKKPFGWIKSIGSKLR